MARWTPAIALLAVVLVLAPCSNPLRITTAHELAESQLQPPVSAPGTLFATLVERGLASARIELPSPQIGGRVEVMLAAGASLGFSVLESAGGFLLEGARVSLSLDDESLDHRLTQLTDENGRAHLDSLVAGRWCW